MKTTGSLLALMFCWIFLQLSICSRRISAATIEDEISAKYWRTTGQNTLEDALYDNRIVKAAKNVIFFLGDGMGVSTVTAIRILKGQKKGKRGEDEELAFDRFPFVSLSKTYAVDRQNPDSANTATAFFCGVKANYGTLGVDGRVLMDDCTASLDDTTHVQSILKKAQEADKRTGFVTSSRVTHATPGALYAHTANRNWEASAPNEDCEDIASQLITKSPGQNINVILGGGTGKFLPNSVKDYNGIVGDRKDNRNLLEMWMRDKKEKNLKAEMVFDYKNFTEIDPYQTDYLLGLFNSSHLPFIVERDNVLAKAPSLLEMTAKAINILKKGSNGYFLVVEGGNIDSGHHYNSAIKALEEGVEFDAAIEKALQMTDREDTLIVVTADHSHPFTISGDYQKRGSPILGIGGQSHDGNKTMTILTYANGPGHKPLRSDLTEEESSSKGYVQDATYGMKYDTHAAEDVAVFAIGPMAHLFHGVHDQSYIPYAVSYAACLGLHSGECAPRTSSAGLLQSQYAIFIPALFALKTLVSVQL